MTSRSAKLTSLSFALVVLAGQVPAQKLTRDNPRFSTAAETEAKARRARIRDEVAGIGAASGWAGSYYRGDGTGVNVNVDLAPRSGFVFEWSGCLGVYDRNYGTCAEKDGRLEFTFTFPTDKSPYRGLASTMVPVRWGNRHYLLSNAKLRGFANAVNSGSEPRDGAHGSALLRRGDEKLPVEGRPELPKEFAALLLAEPVEGSIVTVHESRIDKGDPISWRVTEATIDRGSRHGLREGHVVHFDRKVGAFAGDGVVIELGEQTARIRIRAIVLGQIPAPAVGWKWSTRLWYKR